MTRGVAIDIFGRNVRKSRRGKRSAASAGKRGRSVLIVGVARRSGCVAGRAREKLRQRGAEKGEGKGEREAAGRARGVGHGNIRCAGGGKLGKTVRAGEGNRVFQGKASEVGNVLRRSATCAALCEYEPLFVSAPPGEKQHRIPEKAASREHLVRSAAFCEGQHPSDCRALACCRALFGAHSPVRGR